MSAQPKVLMIGSRLPSPEYDGGSLYLLTILSGFVKLGCAVDYLPRNPVSWVPHGDSDDVSILEAVGVRVLMPPNMPTAQEHWREHLAAHGQQYTLVLLWPESTALQCLDAVRQLASQARVVFVTYDLAHVRLFREAKLKGNIPALQRAVRVKQQEIWLAEHTDYTTVISEAEKRVLQQLCPAADIHVLPFITKIVEQIPPFWTRRDMLFVGYFPNMANVDAVLYFAKEILPLVQNAIPDIKLYVVGTMPPAEIQALHGDSIIVTGFVPNLDDYLGRVRLSVAPLRYGAGVKTKILYSLRHGVPVVTTSIGAEGMHLKSDANVLIADEPEHFAEHVIALHENMDTWKSISEGAQSLVRERFSESILYHALAQLINFDV
jgi:O-antigen biosynthesis protein